MPPIQDQATRQKALNPQQSFIVQAPAGSGKTELLTQRYLALLAHAEKAPEEIIAITFTRKAAAEMRARVLSALAFGKKEAPDKNDYRYNTWHLANLANQRCEKLSWSLIENPNRLRIMTIDALATFICHKTPMLTHFGAAPEITDNAQPLYQLATQQLINTLIENPTHQHSLSHLLLHLDNDTDKLAQLFQHLLAHRDQWLPHILFCHWNKSALKEQLEAGLRHITLEKIKLANQQLPQALKQSLWLLAKHAGEYCLANKPNNPIANCADFNAQQITSLESYPIWLGLSHLLLTKDGKWRKSITVNNGFEAKDPKKAEMLAVLSALQSNEIFRDTLAEIQICPPIFYEENQWQTLTTLTEILPLLAAQLMLVFQETGQVDFVALNLSAQKALGEEDAPTDLALYLDHQIRHILIDEFQDTSVIHMQILEKITAGWLPGDGRTLFLVGDPMQSIYRFRNAEVGLFLRTQQQGIGNIALTPLTLQMNFRSIKSIVNWFNDAFEAIFPASADIPTGRVPYTRAISASEQEIEECVKCYANFSDKSEEITQITQILQELITRYPDDSIAILVRSRAQLKVILESCRNHNIPYQAIDIESLSNRHEIQDLLTLTRALHHRADRLAWLALLRTPFCGCSLSDIHAIAVHQPQKTLWESICQAESIKEISADGLTRLQKLRHTLKAAFNSYGEQSFSHWVEGTWISLGGPAVLKSDDALKQTDAYFTLLEKQTSHGKTLKITQLTHELEQLFALPDRANHANVQVMTIHKSKGLEFDHVILPGLEKQSAADKEKLFRWLERTNTFGGNDLILAPIKSSETDHDPIYHYLKWSENQKQQHEMVRLFYVAATRAKKTLHLFATLTLDSKKPNQLKPPKKGTFLEKCWPILSETISNDFSKSTTKSSSVTATQRKIVTDYERLSTHWQPPAINNDSPFLKIDVNENQNKQIVIPLAIDSNQAQATGTVIHEIFEAITTDQTRLNPTQPWPIAQWKSRLSALGVSANEMNHSLSLVKTAVTNILSDSRGQWITSQTHKQAHSEWALTAVLSNKIHHVIIDRSFIDHDGIRWIIDYKTSAPNDGETLPHFLQKEWLTYQDQLSLYQNIVSKIEDRPVKTALYFPLCKGWICDD